MTKKKKPQSGNPAKRAARAPIVIPSQGALTPAFLNGLRSLQDSGTVLDVWSDLSMRLFTPQTSDDTDAFLAALLSNPRTPVQVVWQIHGALRQKLRASEQGIITTLMGTYWSSHDVDHLPPILSPEEAGIPPGAESTVIDDLLLIIESTDAPSCLLAVWLFTREHLLDTGAPNLPELLEALDRHPNSPDDVTAGVWARTMLN
ncbi:hypothetical protein BC477_02545 [Clavibacter michiganensis subsp. michiganensis]|uniref:Uncharacterized protein n=1 Tax=Clavibacter michiganensis subsp. michiganensis TaxID=33013 RepID=A0A251XK88_CLAMM|nr:hypothetical protein [Clavibacter michiganensis]OUD86846.1 hypothetical protein BC477_02545 [Clavibacter michiganensis subsp. michiganensis]OUE03589.1 hypothetical protein CMMCAS07_01480 [Clavibacter michiganensis subsp. michiganensis]